MNAEHPATKSLSQSASSSRAQSPSISRAQSPANIQYVQNPHRMLDILGGGIAGAVLTAGGMYAFNKFHNRNTGGFTKVANQTSPTPSPTPEIIHHYNKRNYTH
jgi:hypothetical protein